MTGNRVAQTPGHGMATRRGAIGVWTSLLASCLAAPVADARQRIADPIIPDTTIVTPLRRAPRITYPVLTPDTRVAPDDFTFDDIVEDLPSAAEQAAATARVRLAQLSQNYRPNPAIWKIADRNTTIYLFGTIHVLPPGFEWRNAAVERIAAESHTLIVESVDDGSKSAELLTRPVGHGPGLPPLAERVSPNHRGALKRFTDTLPSQATAVMDALPTWIAAVAVSFVKDYRSGEIPGPGADDWFEANFRAANKPVVEIEDGSKVLAHVNAIPDADQRQMLDLALDTPPLPRAAARASTHAWAKGDVGPGSALTVDLQSISGSSSLSAPLLTDRNRAWVTDLMRRMKTVKGTMLFAAGAGHFIGTGSVIDLLTRKGVKVVRVQ